MRQKPAQPRLPRTPLHGMSTSSKKGSKKGRGKAPAPAPASPPVPSPAPVPRARLGPPALPPTPACVTAPASLSWAQRLLTHKIAPPTLGTDKAAVKTPKPMADEFPPLPSNGAHSNFNPSFNHPAKILLNAKPAAMTAVPVAVPAAAAEPVVVALFAHTVTEGTKFLPPAPSPSRSIRGASGPRGTQSYPKTASKPAGIATAASAPHSVTTVSPTPTGTIHSESAVPLPSPVSVAAVAAVSSTPSNAGARPPLSPAKSKLPQPSPSPLAAVVPSVSDPPPDALTEGAADAPGYKPASHEPGAPSVPQGVPAPARDSYTYAQVVLDGKPGKAAVTAASAALVPKPSMAASLEAERESVRASVVSIFSRKSDAPPPCPTFECNVLAAVQYYEGFPCHAQHFMLPLSCWKMDDSYDVKGHPRLLLHGQYYSSSDGTGTPGLNWFTCFRITKSEELWSWFFRGGLAMASTDERNPADLIYMKLALDALDSTWANLSDGSLVGFVSPMFVYAASPALSGFSSFRVTGSERDGDKVYKLLFKPPLKSPPQRRTLRSPDVVAAGVAAFEVFLRTRMTKHNDVGQVLQVAASCSHKFAAVRNVIEMPLSDACELESCLFVVVGRFDRAVYFAPLRLLNSFPASHPFPVVVPAAMQIPPLLGGSPEWGLCIAETFLGRCEFYEPPRSKTVIFGQNLTSRLPFLEAATDPVPRGLDCGMVREEFLSHLRMVLLELRD